MYYTYVLQCNEGRYYIGSTEDIEKRVQQHNSKDFKGWTNRFTNWHVVYAEEYATRTQALIREMEIKSWKGGIKFKTLLAQVGS